MKYASAACRGPRVPVPQRGWKSKEVEIRVAVIRVPVSHEGLEGGYGKAGRNAPIVARLAAK